MNDILVVTKSCGPYMNKWQSAYMDTAERFASLSTAVRLQVGTIVVKDNRIISIGYNGMPAGWDNTCEDEIDEELSNGTTSYKLRTKAEVIHAEANAISKLARSGEAGLGADIYITHAPCVECAKLIYGTGIARVYYKTKYKSDDGIEFLKSCGIEVENL
jgi:dCMP deaminase|tara:strand:- start:310 stop:789 length:480 start_codon:yes stop_codon:yes gene_type:complete